MVVKTPKQMAKSPQNKQSPQSGKRNFPQKSSPAGGKQQTPKQQQMQKSASKGAGGAPALMNKSAAKSFPPTPKQALNFQTPKGQQQNKGQTPKQSVNKQPPSGKKMTTPHPSKKGAQESEDDDDEDDDEFDSEEFDSDEMDSDEEMEDDSDSEVSPAKNNGFTAAAGKKLLKNIQTLAKGQQPDLKKIKNGKPGSDEEEDDEDDDDDEFDSEDEDEDDSSLESEEDEEESDDDESPVKPSPLQKQQQQKLPVGQKQQAQKQQQPAAIAQKGKVAQQQQLKQVKRPAPADDDEEESEDDEDDEDDEEESSEEDSDEEESEDDEVPVKGGKQATKGNKEQAQPQKKQKANDGAAVPVKRPTLPSKLDKKLQDETDQRRRERDSRSLFIKNLPKGASTEEIKALSPDIVMVSRKNPHVKFCWIVFANEESCQKNFKKLKGTKLGKSELFVDLCGEKSKLGPKESATEQRFDALRLYVGNLPPKTTDADVKRLFPTASSVYQKEGRTCSFVSFDSPDKARQAFESNKNAKINGFNVVVSFARMQGEKKDKPDAVKKFAKDQAAGKVVTRG